MTVPHQREEDARIPAPPLRLLAREFGGMLRTLTGLTRAPDVTGLPRGDGHAVVVIPGYLNTDVHTRPLQEALRRLGYAAQGWAQGRNLGLRPPVKAGVLRLIRELHAATGKPVTLIGWSLGGVFARELARSQPQHVRRVITLGSPFNAHPDANNLMALFRLMNRGRKVNLDWDGFQRRRTPPPVPCTAVHTRTDGVVAWQCSREEAAPNTKNVEVRGAHYDLISSPEVVRVIAEQLARPE